MFAFDADDVFQRTRTETISSHDEIYIPGSSPTEEAQRPWVVDTTIEEEYSGVIGGQIRDTQEYVTQVDRATTEMLQMSLNQPHSGSIGKNVEIIAPYKSVDSEASDTNINYRPCPQDFDAIKVLGKGAYGTVILVRHKQTNRLYAQKQLKKASITIHETSSTRLRHTRTERSILEAVRHEFIVKLYYAFQDETKLYLMMEYVPGGELFHYLTEEKIFNEETTAFYGAEICSALFHLHDLGIAYRDLKPENCLLDADGHLVLTDFGLSKEASDGAECRTFCGTIEYLAPEILQGKAYDASVDWWSFGILLYDLMTGSPPFTGNNQKRIIERVLKQKVNLPLHLTRESKDIITKFLKKTPSVRLGSKPEDEQKIRNHPFFRRIDWAMLESRQMKPPLKVFITDPALAENFAPEFTNLPLSLPKSGLSIPSSSFLNSCQNNHQVSFDGFTYVASPTLFNAFDTST